MDGSGLLKPGSGSAKKPGSIWIRIRIRNTALKSKLCNIFLCRNYRRFHYPRKTNYEVYSYFFLVANMLYCYLTFLSKLSAVFVCFLYLLFSLLTSGSAVPEPGELSHDDLRQLHHFPHPHSGQHLTRGSDSTLPTQVPVPNHRVNP